MIKSIVAVLAILGISQTATAPVSAIDQTKDPSKAPATFSPRQPVTPAACSRTDGKPMPPTC